MSKGSSEYSAAETLGSFIFVAVLLALAGGIMALGGFGLLKLLGLV